MDPGQELVDVVDEEDRVVATVTRREVRARGLLHRCTYVLLRNAAGQFLVHRRTDTKDVHPGAHDVFAGGVCAAGESYDECARREVEEELGVGGVDLRRGGRPGGPCTRGGGKGPCTPRRARSPGPGG
jgi:isopentenyldiphosphate isomerase